MLICNSFRDEIAIHPRFLKPVLCVSTSPTANSPQYPQYWDEDDWYFLRGANANGAFVKTATTAGSELGTLLCNVFCDYSEFTSLPAEQLVALLLLVVDERTMSGPAIVGRLLYILYRHLHCAVSEDQHSVKPNPEDFRVEDLKETSRSLVYSVIDLLMSYPADTGLQPGGWIEPIYGPMESILAPYNEITARLLHVFGYDEYCWRHGYLQNIVYRLAPLAEDTIFSAFIHGPMNLLTQPRVSWNDLPTEIQSKIIDCAFVYDENLKITVLAQNTHATTARHAKKPTSEKHIFRISVRIPSSVALNGLQSWIPIRSTGCCSLNRPADLLAPCQVSKSFNELVKASFYGKNTFELHDDQFESGDLATTRYKAGYHWLELQSRHGNMGLLKNVIIDMSFSESGSTPWYICQTFMALNTIPDLKCLIVEVDLDSLITDPGHSRPWGLNMTWTELTERPLLWPGLRMLAWAKSARPKPDRKDFTRLNIYIPDFFEAEKTMRVFTRMEDNDSRKIWVADDWMEPDEGFGTPEIERFFKEAVSRQHQYQEFEGPGYDVDKRLEATWE